MVDIKMLSKLEDRYQKNVCINLWTFRINIVCRLLCSYNTEIDQDGNEHYNYGKARTKPTL